jgi:NADH-quinone oxidoreductase subunit M
MFDGARGAAGDFAGVLRDLTPREIAMLVPLAAITLWMGIYPSSFTRVFDPAVTAIAASSVQAPVAPGASADHG